MDLGFIVKPLISVLNFFYSFTNSWGWSIILLTLTIRLILFPSSVKQFRSMEKMKKIQPKMKEIQEKYKDKPEELQRRTMELYQQEKVNPFSSCLPMLIQLPLLWAMFDLLKSPKYEVAALISQSHFLWFSLKSLHDIPLALLSGGTTFLQQKLTMTASTGDDQMQKNMLMIMPIFFAYITWTVNAGLGLYWVANNIFSIIQQVLINEYFLVKERIHKDEIVDSKKK